MLHGRQSLKDPKLAKREVPSASASKAFLKAWASGFLLRSAWVHKDGPWDTKRGGPKTSPGFQIQIDETEVGNACNGVHDQDLSLQESRKVYLNRRALNSRC